nr:MAG: nonstructural protein [Riboviria sp.]
MSSWIAFAANEGYRLARHHEPNDIVSLFIAFIAKADPSASTFIDPFVSFFSSELTENSNELRTEADLDWLAFVPKLLSVLGVALALVVFNKRPSTFNVDKLSDTLMDSLKKITTLERGISSLASLKTVLEEFFNSLCAKFMGPTYALQLSIKNGELRAWCTEIDELTNPKNDHLVLSDVSYQVRVRRAMDLVPTARHFCASKTTPAGLVRFILDRVRILEAKYEMVLKTHGKPGLRASPFCIWIYGPHGVGKTTMCAPLADQLLDLEKCPKNNRFYSRNVADKYWSKYHGQDCVFIQDLCLAAQSDNADVTEFLAMAGVDEYNLNGASIADKGMPFVSRLIIVSNNFHTPNLTGRCTDEGAFRRRRAVVLQTRAVPEVEKNPSFSHIEFRMIDRQTENQPLSEWMSYPEMVKQVRVMYVDHRRKEKTLMAQRKQQVLGHVDIENISEYADLWTEGIDDFEPKVPQHLASPSLWGHLTPKEYKIAAFNQEAAGVSMLFKPYVPVKPPLPPIIEEVERPTTPVYEEATVKPLLPDNYPLSLVTYDNVMAVTGQRIDHVTFDMSLHANLAIPEAEAMRYECYKKLKENGNHPPHFLYDYFSKLIEESVHLVTPYIVRNNGVSTLHLRRRLINGLMHEPHYKGLIVIHSLLPMMMSSEQFAILNLMIAKKPIFKHPNAKLCVQLVNEDSVWDKLSHEATMHPIMARIIGYSAIAAAVVSAYIVAKLCKAAINAVIDTLYRLITLPYTVYKALTTPEPKQDPQIDTEALVASGDSVTKKIASRKVVRPRTGASTQRQIVAEGLISMGVKPRKARKVAHDYKLVPEAILDHLTDVSLDYQEEKTVQNIQACIDAFKPILTLADPTGAAYKELETYVASSIREELIFTTEALSDKNANDLINSKLIPATVIVGSLDNPHLIRGIMIKGTYLLLPKHFVYCVQPEQTLRITYHTGTSMTFDYKKKNAIMALSEDVMIIDVGARHPSAPDITKHFISDSELGYNTELRATLLTPTVEKGIHSTRQQTGMVLLHSVENDDQPLPFKPNQNDKTYQEFVAQGWKYSSFETDLGYCGSPLVGLKPSLLGKILGVHTLGGKQFGLSAVVTRELLLMLLPDQLKPEGMANGFIPTLEESMDNAQIVPQGNFTYFGTLRRPVFAATKTKLRKSLIHGMAFPVNEGPSVLTWADQRLDEDRKGISPLLNGIEKFGIPTLPFDSDHLKIVQAHTSAIMLPWKNDGNIRRVLTLDEAVNGVSTVTFMDPLTMDTSEGYPWILSRKGTGKRSKAWMFDVDHPQPTNPSVIHYTISHQPLLDAVSDRIVNAKRGLRTPCIFTDSTKDEKRKLAKIQRGETRTFSIPPLDYTIAVRMYFLAFSAAQNNSRFESFSAIGMDPHSFEWSHMLRYLKEASPKGIAGDYKKWDGKVDPECLMACADMISDWYDDGEENRLVRQVLIEESIHTWAVALNIMYSKHQGLPSGFPLTANINSIINYMYMQLAWLKLSPQPCLRVFDKNVRMKVYGDDNLIAIGLDFLETYNQRTISEFFLTKGIVYTTADKAKIEVDYFPLEDLSFLKRKFRRDEHMTSAWHCPLDMDSIHGMTNWIRECHSHSEATVENCETALMELYEYGEQAFAEGLQKINKALTNKGIAPIVFVYAQQQNAFFERNA